jgi:hypothetical protein
MKSTKTILSLFITVLLFACNHDYDQQLNNIDNLISKYDTLEKKVFSVDLKESKQQLLRYENTIKEFKKLQNNKQKPTKEVRMYINEFRTIKKTFKKVPKNVSFLNSSISQNIIQLDNLKADIKKNSFSQKELNKIIGQEQEAFQLLDSNYYKLSLDIKTQTEKFDSLLILSGKIKF